MNEPAEIAEALKGCRTVLISAHKSPDGDTLGCQLGLMLALEKLGKIVTAHNLDPVPEIYRFLPRSASIRTGPLSSGRFDAWIVVDSDPPRTGLFGDAAPADVLINIDHHATNPGEWRLTWIDSGAAACGELVYKLIRELGAPIDPEIALCLFTAIVTDTGSFRHSNTTAVSMKTAADLLEAGAEPRLVTENVYESCKFGRIKLLGDTLSGMEKTEDGRIAWVTVTEEAFRKTGTTAEDSDNFITFVRSVKGVEVAVLFRQTAAEQYKISLRSKGRIDLTAMAQSLGGGGHKNAAGGVMDGGLEKIKALVLDLARKAVDEQSDEDGGRHGRGSQHK
jgi:bifunctional oligoribonuclease and PAP phosphatase NrnA